MLPALYVVSMFLLAVTMGLALAHALEFPGKLRLDEPTYRAVQAIYYPGFTIGGLIGEFGAMLVVPVLLYLSPSETGRSELVIIALASLLACHAIYWTVTHPVNKAWLAETELGSLSGLFFGLTAGPSSDWQRMRLIWEWSHVVRAAFACVSFLAMTFAILL